MKIILKLIELNVKKTIEKKQKSKLFKKKKKDLYLNVYNIMGYIFANIR